MFQKRPSALPQAGPTDRESLGAQLPRVPPPREGITVQTPPSEAHPSFWAFPSVCWSFTHQLTQSEALG